MASPSEHPKCGCPALPARHYASLHNGPERHVFIWAPGREDDMALAVARQVCVGWLSYGMACLIWEQVAAQLPRAPVAGPQPAAAAPAAVPPSAPIVCPLRWLVGIWRELRRWFGLRGHTGVAR